MKVPLKVKYQDGGEKHVVARSREAVEFERRYQMPWANIYGTLDIKADPKTGQQFVPGVPPKEEHWYFVAWFALNRTGEDTRDFESFINAIDGVDFDMDLDTAEPVPFDQAPSDGSSPPSPPGE